VVVKWRSEPGVGAGGLAGYRLYRAQSGAHEYERVGPELIVEEEYRYPERERDSRYRVVGVDVAGGEITLGEVEVPHAREGLGVWPTPLGAGALLHVVFAAPLEAGGKVARDLEVAVYDVVGRRVATLARGGARVVIGEVELQWDRRTDRGERAAAGLYFVQARSRSQHFELRKKLIVVGP